MMSNQVKDLTPDQNGSYQVTVERSDGDEWIWTGTANDAEEALTLARNAYLAGKGSWI